MKQAVFGSFYHPEAAPIHGVTAESRASSTTGAACAEETRSRNIVRMRVLWKTAHTLNEMADLMGLPITSICSLKSALEAALTFDSYEHVDHGPQRKATKRKRWRLRSTV